LNGIIFPGFPKLLSSATHLVRLRLTEIYRFAFIPPEAMVALLSVLSSLDTLELDFDSHQSFRDWERRSQPPRNLSILPALNKFHFRGVTKYLEDLVTFIDTPQLNYFYINFFRQFDFDTPQLAQFINRTPKLRKRDAHVQFHDSFACVELPAGSGTGTLKISISYTNGEQFWQLSSIAQVCNFSLPPPSTIEDLYIESGLPPVRSQVNDAVALWVQLLLPFTATKNLYLSKGSAPGIAAALQELVEGRITEVLPNLQNIFVEGLEPSGPVQENIRQFVVQQLSDHLITISVWDKDTNVKPM
jgi:hypothetical protein